MTITALDLKFRQSERMTDFTDGGGRMGATEIVSGVMDNVFSDLSDADGLRGDVSLRKIFAQVNSANTDTCLGPFFFLTDLPLNPNVSVLAFQTKSATDERSDARNYYESYRLKGVKSQYVLYGMHYAGQRMLQVYCRAEIPSPDIGDVWCLSIEGAGYTPAEQYVKVEKVESRQTVTFTDASGDFERDVLILTLSSDLVAAFPGREDPVRISTTTGVPTVIRFTQQSATAKYYGFKPLAAPSLAGDAVVNVGTPYVPAVPATQSQLPVVDQLAGLGSLSMIPSGATGALTWSGALSAGAGASLTLYFGTPFAKRSLTVLVGGVELRDDGNGGIVATDPAQTGWSGAVSYDVGSFTIARDVAWGGSSSATATPAGAVTDQSFSLRKPIAAANRSLSYVFQLPSAPSPGSTVLDYLALGKWIRLRDNGAGQLVGNPGEGTATINYATRSLAVTLGALPDVGSSLVVAWGTDLRAKNSSGDITIPTPTYRQQLDHPGIVPSTFGMTWTSGGVARSATYSGGAISGAAMGKLDAANGIVEFSTATPADNGTGYTYAYDYASNPTAIHVETFTPTAAGGAVAITLAHLPKPGSVIAQWNLMPPTAGYGGGGTSVAHVVIDDGAGGFVNAFPSTTNTIDYGDGDIVLTVESIRTWVRPQYTWEGDAAHTAGSYTLSSWMTSDLTSHFAAGTPLVVSYVDASASVNSATEAHVGPTMRIYLGDGAVGPAVPGSVRFAFRGRTYVDRSGTLVYGVDANNNAGTVAGSIDYANNTATLSDYATGGNTVSITSLLTRYQNPGISGIFFRAPGSPLQEGSFTLRATTLDGTDLTGSADINGTIAGTQMRGIVQWTSGLASVQFGSLVTAAGNESQPWYDVDLVDGDGKIFAPVAVDPGSIFFGTVIYRAIPVDPELIGIDPVRLPSDGRVPAFRAGEVGFVSYTKVQTLTPSAGAVTNTSLDRLDSIEILDALGTPITDTWYTVDLDDGTVTWANPLNLSAYTMPVTVRSRIVDAALIADVQITGEITFATALTHAYPDGSIVSCAVPFTDMQARIANVFDQQTYQAGVWSDVLVGSPAAGTYNTVLYPIEVSNDAAIDERWAIVFTGTTTVNVIGETVGQVITGASITADIAPINPVTVTVDDPAGKPYFTIRKEGWGGGWASGNLVRFNAISATRPIWLARIVTPGELTAPNDRVRANLYGNAN